MVKEKEKGKYVYSKLKLPMHGTGRIHTMHKVIASGVRETLQELPGRGKLKIQVQSNSTGWRMSEERLSCGSSARVVVSASSKCLLETYTAANREGECSVSKQNFESSQHNDVWAEVMIPAKRVN
jgi:hypothetical protein